MLDIWYAGQAARAVPPCEHVATEALGNCGGPGGGLGGGAGGGGNGGGGRGEGGLGDGGGGGGGSGG